MSSQSRLRHLFTFRGAILMLLVEAFSSTVAGAQEGSAPAVSATPSEASGLPSLELAPAKRGAVQQRSRTSRRRVRRRSRVVALPPLRHTTPTSAPALAGDLGTLLSSRVRNGRWGVMVVSLTRGDTLYSQNADAMLSPASNMKLFTAAIALDQFGPNHQFSTDVLREGEVGSDGNLLGNLVLRGDGDPALSSRFASGSLNAPMELLAQYVASSGIKRVRGDLIADASAFDQQRIPEGWQSRNLSAGYAARVSALSLNENLVWVVVHPGASSKEPASIFLEPATDIAVTGTVRSVAGSRAARVIVRSRAQGRIEVRGWIGTRAAPRRYQVVVEDPASFAAGAFRRALAQLGVSIDGTTRFGVTPATATKIASLPSPPMSRLLSVMNRESVNHFAELLFRNAARRATNGVGTVEAGNTLLQQFMTEKAGAAPGTTFAADGSGLSVLDRTTPRALIQLLDYAHKASWSDAFHASLPVAGESELLRYRMRYTPAQGNLHAKTGTTNTVISLGGYVTAQDGEVLAFAFIYNGADRSYAKQTIDAMGATLASFVRE